MTFRKCSPNPLHPLPNLPSGTTIKPFRRPWTSSEIIKNLPWELEPNCKINTLSPSLKVRAKFPAVTLDMRSSTIVSKRFAPSLPMKTDRRESRFISKMRSIK
ncbi:hypothetical protein ACB098_11G034900 [Castanea mollissima]